MKDSVNYVACMNSFLCNLLMPAQNISLHQRFPTRGTRTPGVKTEVFQGVRGWLAEGYVNGATNFTLCGLQRRKRVSVILSNSHKTYSCQANIQIY